MKWNPPSTLCLLGDGLQKTKSRHFTFLVVDKKSKRHSSITLFTVVSELSNIHHWSGIKDKSFQNSVFSRRSVEKETETFSSRLLVKFIL